MAMCVDDQPLTALGIEVGIVDFAHFIDGYRCGNAHLVHPPDALAQALQGVGAHGDVALHDEQSRPVLQTHVALTLQDEEIVGRGVLGQVAQVHEL